MDPLAVFLIDDEPDFHVLFQASVWQTGLHVTGAESDPHEGLKAWRSQAPLPDIVVTDYRMPTMTGIELAARMLGEAPHQCIVLLTADRVERWLRHSAADAGIATVLGKENLPLLPAALQECYEQHQQRTQRQS